MALFTKLFGRRQDPYDLKGRWYKFHVTSDGTAITSVKGDFPSVNDGTSGIRILPQYAGKVLSVLDYVVDFTTVPGSTTNFVKSIYCSANANQYTIFLPNVARYTELDVYVYMVEK